MDKQNNGTCYGLPILNEEEVTQKAYCIIIIISTTFNVNIIYNRIQDWTLKIIFWFIILIIDET